MGSRRTGMGAAAANLQLEDILCRTRGGRGDAGAGGCGAERRWLLIGWARATLGGNVGAGAAPGPPGLRVTLVPV